MKARQNSWTRGVAGGLALLLSLTVAAPCWAGEATATAVPGPSSLRAVADAKLAELDSSKAVRFAQAGAAGTAESKPFFKSSKGVAVVVLMVGGLTWAVVSRSKDAVHSPAR